jgi:predicted NBD/HSP70 family sugar kinase
MIALAVDVGGTTTCAGAVTGDGRVLVEEHVPTHADGPGEAVETIVALLERVQQRARPLGEPVVGIGVGVPAIVDAEHGHIGEEAPHVPALAGRSLGPELATRFGLPAFIDNDVNALALAEWQFGAARGTRSLVVLAPGTGFGSGIVLDGRLVRGAAGFGGEFGHAPVKYDGPPCWCGGQGCLAVYASGRGIGEAARSRVAGHANSPLLAAAGGHGEAITASLVFRLADQDPVAAAVVDDACRALGAMIAIVVNGLNPEMIVVTGGVAAAFAPRERRVLAAAASHAFARALASTRVVFVPSDKRVTMRGAAALVLYELDRRSARPA